MPELVSITIFFMPGRFHFSHVLLSDVLFAEPGDQWVQVKVQTVPGYAKGLSDGLPKVIAEEGVGGCGILHQCHP